ncbi:MAG: hypothetical protein WDO18_08515 [Acidobacteriota bacterium]
MDSAVRKFATVLVAHRWACVLMAGGALILGLPTPGAAQLRPEWRHVGNSALDIGLADLATGPVERVAYATDGRLGVVLSGLRTFETRDFSTWQPLSASSYLPPIQTATPSLPEASAQVRVAPADSLRVYAVGRFVYRSEDGGRHWENLTSYKGFSIIGAELRDAAVSPRNPDEIVVAGAAGLYRSVDGGRSWHGLNDQLLNLPGARLVSPPLNGRGAQIEFGGGQVFEWLPGERRAWRISTNDQARMEWNLRQYFSEELGVEITAVAVRGDYVYMGDVNGTLHVSSDSGRTWLRSQAPQRGRVNSFWLDSGDGRNAIAVLAQRTSGPVQPLIEPQTVLHTINGGGGWETVSGGLPNVDVNGVTADLTSNVVYVGTSGGVYQTKLSLKTYGDRVQWTLLPGLPAGRVIDTKLDAGETQCGYRSKVWVCMRRWLRIGRPIRGW